MDWLQIRQIFASARIVRQAASKIDELFSSGFTLIHFSGSVTKR